MGDTAIEPLVAVLQDPNDTNVMDGAYSVAVSGAYAYVAGYTSNNLAILV